MDTEGIFSELRDIFEEKRYHPHNCVIPYHKDSRGLEEKSRREHYSKDIETHNSEKNVFDLENEKLEE